MFKQKNMYGRLSPQSVEFIKKGATTLNDYNYHNALINYRKELTQIINEVCAELNQTGNKSSWSASIDAEEQDEELGHCSHYKLTSAIHEDLSLKMNIYTNTVSTIIVEFNDEYISRSVMNTIISIPSIKRYFSIENYDNRIEMKTQFSKRQLHSRYLLDYIIHLIKQLNPLLDSFNQKKLLKAA